MNSFGKLVKIKLLSSNTEFLNTHTAILVYIVIPKKMDQGSVFRLSTSLYFNFLIYKMVE